MRSQKVSVDVWKMIFSSCSYLGLAFAAWVLIKLVYACFWLPNYLKNEENDEHASNMKSEETSDEESKQLKPQDKKND